MHGLAVFLEVIGLALLIIEAIERRAGRWRVELEGADAAIEDLFDAARERTGLGSWWSWRGGFFPQRIFLLIGIGFASLIARFDDWKARHGLSDLFFIFAVACGVSGVAVSVAIR